MISAPSSVRSREPGSSRTGWAAPCHEPVTMCPGRGGSAAWKIPDERPAQGHIHHLDTAADGQHLEDLAPRPAPPAGFRRHPAGTSTPAVCGSGAAPYAGGPTSPPPVSTRPSIRSSRPAASSGSLLTGISTEASPADSSACR